MAASQLSTGSERQILTQLILEQTRRKGDYLAVIRMRLERLQTRLEQMGGTISGHENRFD